mgnify:CR=1 FL=1
MNSWEYRLFYREQIWSYAVLACYAKKHKNHSQFKSYHGNMINYIEALSEIMKQEAIS